MAERATLVKRFNMEGRFPMAGRAHDNNGHAGLVVMLPATVRTIGAAYRPVIRTTVEALRFIDEELPIELREKRRWTFARELMVVAGISGKKRDIANAFRQLKRALDDDRLLA